MANARSIGSAMALVVLLAGGASRTSADTASDGTWTDWGPIGRGAHTAICDPVRGRMIVYGGTDGLGRDDVWALPLAGPPVWTEIHPIGTPPNARGGHTAIYDPLRDRMIVFGGIDSSAFRNDVWALSLSGTPIWTQLAPTGTPPSARYCHAAVYDPMRDRMLVIGGYDGGPYLNDVWALSLSGTPSWVKLAPTGPLPAGRYGHSAIYDPARDRVIVFAGLTSASVGYGDVWILSLGPTPAWTEMVTVGTMSRTNGHRAVYDPIRDQMVVTGPITAALTLGESPTWIPMATPGVHSWELSWHSAIYDPRSDRTVVFGGSYSDLGAVWALSYEGASPVWTEVLPGAVLPRQDLESSAVYDASRNQMYLFGGIAPGSETDGGTWALALFGTPDWTALNPPGPTPQPRYGHAAIFDPVRDRMIVFGGITSVTSPQYLNDIWGLSFADPLEWTQMTPSGTPPSPRKTKAIYDPVRDRMIIFGGSGSPTGNDVWALSLDGSPAWTELHPDGGPPPAPTSYTLVYDSAHDRVLMCCPNCPMSVWALSLGEPPSWSEIVASGATPPGRLDCVAIYDAIRDRMVIFGGMVSGLPANDVWALSLGDVPEWTELHPAGEPPYGRSRHVAIFDAEQDRLITYGDGPSDVWSLTWEAPQVSVPREIGPMAQLELAPPRPNPSLETVTLSFTLPEPGRAVLTVYDAAGRARARLMDGLLTPGMHSTVWNARDGDGRRVPSGVYFVRLQAPGTRRALVRRVVVLDPAHTLPSAPGPR